MRWNVLCDLAVTLSTAPAARLRPAGTRGLRSEPCRIRRCYVVSPAKDPPVAQSMSSNSVLRLPNHVHGNFLLAAICHGCTPVIPGFGIGFGENRGFRLLRQVIQLRRGPHSHAGFEQ